MKINLLQELKTLEGDPIIFTRKRTLLGEKGELIETEKNEVMTIKTPCINALMGRYEDEKSLSGEDQCKRGDLAQTIQDSQELEATPEEIAMIRKLVAKAYSSLITRQVWKMMA